MDGDQDYDIPGRIGSVLAAVDLFRQVSPRPRIQIARAHRASLTVVHVLDVRDGTPLPAMPDRQKAEAAARTRIAAVFTQFGTSPSDAIVGIESGPPSLRLIELCEDLRADPIVIRAHERERIVEKMIGSTTDRVIRAAAAPMLVVKRPDEWPYCSALVAADVSNDTSPMASIDTDMLPGAKLHLVHTVQIPPQLE